MTDMRIVESGLIPIYEGDGQERLVNARELHGFLGSGWDFSNWIQDRLSKYGFAEGRDFSREYLKTPTGGRPRIEYWLTTNCAKEIAMVENNRRGQQIRRYLIEVEERYRAGMMPAEQMLTDPDFLVALATRYRDERNARLAAEARVVELAPKAAFHDQVADAAGTQSIAEVARVLGTGQNRLFRWMRDQHILLSNNLPYQQYLDAGYFRVIEQTWTHPEGGQRLAVKTLVTGRGLAWLQRRYHSNVVQLPVS